MPRTTHAVLALFIVALAACAKSSPPLPGDSVSPDGGVTLTPPRMSPVSAPVEAPSPAAPLGAVESRLFAPEVVMDHQAAIALTAPQKDAITREVERAQKELLALQWELSAEKEKLLVVLDEPHVDEDKSQKAAARLMERETKIKAAHLAMLVRVKNVLTPEQQKKLRDLREPARPARAAMASGNDAGSRVP